MFRRRLKEFTTVDKWRFLGVILALAVIGSVFYDIGARINANQESIEKACILINNAVIRSEIRAADPEGPTAILIRAILENAQPDTVREYQESVKESAGKPHPLLVDCKAVAQDPSSIDAAPLIEPPNR